MSPRDEAYEAVEAGELKMVLPAQETPVPFMSRYPDLVTLIGRMKTREAEAAADAKSFEKDGDSEMKNYSSGFSAGMHAALCMLGRTTI